MQKGTKKHIATTYIEVAEKVILEGKKDNVFRFKNRLIKNNIEIGICNFYFIKFNSIINNKPYIVRYSNVFSIGEEGGNFWFKCPKYAKSKKEAVELLQKRINILKTWL